jgi:hypothetical protein
MNGLESETVIVGSFLFAGELAYLGFLAVKRNYFKLSVSASITKPADRFLPPEPAAEPAATPKPSLREAS